MSKKAQYLLIGTIVSWTVGFLGGDRFYKGETGLGILKLITFGALGVWYLVDALIWTAKLGKELSE